MENLQTQAWHLVRVWHDKRKTEVIDLGACNHIDAYRAYHRESRLTLFDDLTRDRVAQLGKSLKGDTPEVWMRKEGYGLFGFYGTRLVAVPCRYRPVKRFLDTCTATYRNRLPTAFIWANRVDYITPDPAFKPLPYRR